MKKRTLRALACSLAAVLAVTLGLALGACSTPSPEDVVRQDLTERLDEVKGLDDAAIDELVSQMDTSQLEAYGIDGGELVTSMLDGFDYSIDSVTVDEGTATAEVTVTCKSMTDLGSEVAAAAAAMLEEDPTILTLDESQINQRVGELMMEAISSTEPRETTVSFTYTKSGDAWEMDDGSVASFSQIFV